jgi:3-hydroxybutyryl-CoA dehydrogenase
MNNVVVYGAGMMGSQIGCEYAAAGCEVIWVVRSAQRARPVVLRAFDLAAETGLISSDAVRGVLGRTRIVEADLPPDRPDLVVESIEERLESKVALLAPLATIWPETIFATNTSSIEIGAIGTAIGAPDRTIGTHYWNPPLLMPLVELTPGPGTDPEVVDRMRSQLLSMGKRPVLLRKDVPGFLWNRLQFALLRETLWLVDNGVANPEDVDEVIRDGLARRWQLLGPFESAALGGVGTWEAVASTLFPLLSDAVDAATLPAHVGRIDAGRREALQRRRDSGLITALADDRNGDAG